MCLSDKISEGFSQWSYLEFSFCNRLYIESITYLRYSITVRLFYLQAIQSLYKVRPCVFGSFANQYVKLKALSCLNSKFLMD